MESKNYQEVVENNDIDFATERILRTTGDIEMMRENLKPYIWENIPLLGCYCYIFRIFFKEFSMDRKRPLRREIHKTRVAFMFITMFLWSVIVMFTPWLLYLTIKSAVDEVQIKLDNNKI